MSVFTTLEISASGLTAQRQRLNVIAENLANTHTTRTPQGGPYLRKNVILEAQPVEAFVSFLEVPQKVAVAQVVASREGLKPEYDPTHPDADDQGMVLWPNVNPVAEMVSLALASRAFEANIAVFRVAKAMALKALEIGRG
jgi:flagellar basal-body rod protein FlgC|uniref:Flagellar basal-body rod protein FlgC n=1 Tax=Desulfobacca acetoxidans TaxID=60893 RepID=A0A7C3SK54_9BACT